VDPHAAAPIAALWRRSAAYLVDSFIVGLVYLVVGTLFDTLFGPLVETTPDGTALVVVAVEPLRVALELAVTLAIDGLYFAGSWGRWGASPAQRVLRVRVQVAQGVAQTLSRDSLSVEAAWRRWAILAVGPIALGSLAASGALDIDLLVVLNGAWFLVLLVSTVVDPLRRGLHDRVAGTVVVAVPARRA
jgi:uncharacterized RDD family membrane protein YckC